MVKIDFISAKKIFMQRCFAKNLTDDTIRVYEDFFHSVEKLLIKKNDITDIEQMTPQMLRQYFIDTSKTMAGITQQGYYRRLNTFFNFLVSENVLSYNPLTKVDKPKAGKRLIQSFDSAEVYKMLHCFDTATFAGCRNYTLLSLLLSTGLRRSEYLALNMQDVDLVNDFIRVIGKGDKERIVPISKALHIILRRYIKAREEHLQRLGDTPAFFVTRYGSRMKRETSNTIFRNMRKELKLTGKRFSAHTWRHTFAKAFLLNGGDVFTLQELLGHADVETTKIYVNLTDNEKRIQNGKYNPLDNSKWQYY